MEKYQKKKEKIPLVPELTEMPPKTSPKMSQKRHYPVTIHWNRSFIKTI